MLEKNLALSSHLMKSLLLEIIYSKFASRAFKTIIPNNSNQRRWGRTYKKANQSLQATHLFRLVSNKMNLKELNLIIKLRFSIRKEIRRKKEYQRCYVDVSFSISSFQRIYPSLFIAICKMAKSSIKMKRLVSTQTRWKNKRRMTKKRTSSQKIKVRSIGNIENFNPHNLNVHKASSNL